MLWAWAVNIHPGLCSMKQVSARGYIYLKFCRKISQMVNLLDLFKVGSQSVLQLLQAGCVYNHPGEYLLQFM